LLFCCGAGLAIEAERPVGRLGNNPHNLPTDVQLFDLHDPELVSAWPTFLATTPMLNNEMLPSSLQNRLTHIVATYRALTPVDRPAFFVATYLDVLSDGLLTGTDDEILPMRVCPVFASGSNASVSSLLAVASGLPDELFVDAPGAAERYRYLFLQTEFSHCRFLSSIRAATGTELSTGSGASAGIPQTRLSFVVGERNYTATVRSKEELRALLETVGEVDATAMLRQQSPGGGALNEAPFDEAQVLSYIRLLSLLATDGKNGYAAIPVLFPLLSNGTDTPATAANGSLQIADALDVAYRARDEFRQLVPFPIRDSADLLSAKLTVMQALAERDISPTGDVRVKALLDRFVIGADLLLVTTLAHEAGTERHTAQ
jgi:hypothetical protein